MTLPEWLTVAMFITACLFLVGGFPVAFTLAGTALVFATIGQMLGALDMALISALPQRIFMIMTNNILVAVPLFVFMGVMLERSGVAEELLDNMGRLFGSLPGGLGISVFVVGALLAASTGIVGATVVTMGLLSLPTMLRRGYDPAMSCGAVCAAGTLGQIIPPSIVLVLLGDQIANAYQEAQLRQNIFSPEAVSVGDMFAGALFPGLMLVAMYIAYQVVMAWLRPETSPAIPRDEEQALDSQVYLYPILRALAAPLILITAVLGSILTGIATPTEAAGVGAIGALLLAGYRLDEERGWPMLLAGLSIVAMLIITSFLDLRMSRDNIPPIEIAGIAAAVAFSAILAWGVLVSVLRVHANGVLAPVMRSTMEISSMVFVILIGAALFSLTFRGFGGDVMVEHFLVSLPGGMFTAMIVVMAIMFLLGFFLDFIEITFVVVPIVAPILLQMDMSPVWLGVMMAVNLQTSFLTPPFGFALFYLRGVAPDEITTGHIYRGIIPYVIIQIIGLVLLAIFPGIATWLPSVIFG